MFNYQGAQVPFTGNDPADPNIFEVGLDISPLTDFIETDGPVRIFLIVDERDSWSGNGGLVRSMMVYNNFNNKDSVVCERSMVPMENNSRTLLSVEKQVRFNRIRIKEVPMLFAKSGDYVSVQMEVAGAASPYFWELVPDYNFGFRKMAMPEWAGSLLYNGQFGNPVNRIVLPFKFRFFGQEYDHVSITEDAELLFDQEENGYPYAIDEKLVFQSIKKINGFGTDLDYYMNDNSISCFVNDTVMAVTWKAIAPTAEGGVPVEIVCEIYPDGRIRYLYDKPEILFPPGATIDIGVSNGDGQLFRRVSTFNKDQVEGANSFVIDPYKYPKETKFDNTGWLFCRPDVPDDLYEIKVRVVDKNNRTSYSTVKISTRDLAELPILSENFPNPFTDETRFRIIVPEKAYVKAEIFDIRGSRVAIVFEGEYISAEYQVSWKGVNDQGGKVSPGVYICRLNVGGRVESRKFIKSN